MPGRGANASPDLGEFRDYSPGRRRLHSGGAGRGDYRLPAGGTSARIPAFDSSAGTPLATACHPPPSRSRLRRRPGRHGPRSGLPPRGRARGLRRAPAARGSRTPAPNWTPEASPPSGSAPLEAFDSAQLALGGAGSLGYLAKEVHPDKAMRDAGETCLPGILGGGHPVFVGPRHLRPRWRRCLPRGLDVGSRYYLDRTLLQFRLAGVDRDEPTRNRVRQLNEELVKTSQEFNRNIRESVLKPEVDPSELDGLPADYVRAHPRRRTGRVALFTDSPDYFSFMSYAKSVPARERFRKLDPQRAHPDNLAMLDRMLAQRHELATLLGFANWADYVTAGNMILINRTAGENSSIGSRRLPRPSADRTTPIRCSESARTTRVRRTSCPGTPTTSPIASRPSSTASSRSRSVRISSTTT